MATETLGVEEATAVGVVGAGATVEGATEEATVAVVPVAVVATEGVVEVPMGCKRGSLCRRRRRSRARCRSRVASHIR